MKTSSYSYVFGSILFAGYFWYCILTPTDWHFIDGVNLIFHEAGHAICFFLPALITAAAGSGFQILIPTVCVFYFWNRREVVSASLLGLWVAQNVMSVSIYMRDAIEMQLPLLGGDSSIHDWNFIFSTLGILTQSILIANCFAILSYSCLIGSTLWLTISFVKEAKRDS
jgi:hypothetical protein